MNPVELVNISLHDILWSGVAALGFAILFNVPRRLLIGCFVAGALGHTLRTLLNTSGASIEFSTLVGAVVVGFVSIYLARRYAVPASIFAVTGAIPLVPGVFAYQTIIGILHATAVASDESIQYFAEAGINGVRTALILSSIAFGIAAPTLLFRRSDPAV